MEFMTTKQAAEQWGISQRRVAFLCERGRITGARKAGIMWLIPPDAKKPNDARVMEKGTRSESVIFLGIDLYINEKVFLPRKRSEKVIEYILSQFEDIDSFQVLDIATGSGALGLAVASRTNAKVTVSDISEDALTVASLNAQRNNISLQVVKSDYLQSIEGTYNLLISNPPYSSKAEIELFPEDVKNIEPYISLFGGETPLSGYEKICLDARKCLAKNGHIVYEVSPAKKVDVHNICKSHGYLVKMIEFDDIVIFDLS